MGTRNELDIKCIYLASQPSQNDLFHYEILSYLVWWQVEEPHDSIK